MFCLKHSGGVELLKGYDFENLIGKKVLIVGDVGSGKTTLTRALLIQAIELLPSGSITVIDMAPPMRKIGRDYAGGGIRKGKWVANVKYLRSAAINPPRLDGRTKEEVLDIAKSNATELEKLLMVFLNRPSDTLFINDLTMYLHSGDAKFLFCIVERTYTFITNAYKGSCLLGDRGSGISSRECHLVTELEKRMDLTIRL
jgi:hypothetical protein